MVGETRDCQTLKTSVRAAVTGHLVLSHASYEQRGGDCGADAGAEPDLAASSLSGILAQRLVRKICPDCKTERNRTGKKGSFWDGNPPDPVRNRIAPAAAIRDTRAPVVHEVLAVDKTIRAMIAGGCRGGGDRLLCRKISWE